MNTLYRRSLYYLIVHIESKSVSTNLSFSKLTLSLFTLYFRLIDCLIFFKA